MKRLLLTGSAMLPLFASVACGGMVAGPSTDGTDPNQQAIVDPPVGTGANPREDAGSPSTMPPPSPGETGGGGCAPGTTCDAWQEPFDLAGDVLMNAGPFNIVARDGSLYWMNTPADGSDGTIVRGPSDGGSPVVLAHALEPATGVVDAQIAVGDDAVYWMNRTNGSGGQGDLMAVSLAGGTPRTVVAGLTDPHQISFSGGNLYWVTGDGGSGQGVVMTVPAIGGTPRSFDAAHTACSLIVLDASSLYCASTLRSDSQTGAIKRIPLAGGSATTLVSGITYVSAMSVDATNVYWSTGYFAPITTTNYALVRSVPLTGGAPRTLYEGTSVASSIASDATYAYWTLSSPATLMRAPLSGGAAESIVNGAGPDWFIGLAVDGGAIYWGDDDDTVDHGVIRKRPAN